MDQLIVLASVFTICAGASPNCVKTKLPLELGKWKHTLQHLDSTVVENQPVSMAEGQVYVYENNFPEYTIKYIHVDNVAMRTCGASANIKSGGVGTSTLMVVLHADTNQEIRSVIDIWGVKNQKVNVKSTVQPVTRRPDKKIIRSRYLL